MNMPVDRAGWYRSLFRVAMRHPGKVIAAAYWFATGRRVRARGRLRDAVAALPFAYGAWVKDCAARDRLALRAATRENGPDRKIGIHLHIGAGTGLRDARAALASLFNQSWPHWHLYVTFNDEAGQRTLSEYADPRVTILAGGYPSRMAGLMAALEATDTSYLVPLDSEVRLPVQSLEAYAAAIHGRVDEPVMYGDQDEIDTKNRRSRPWFKPDWDGDMILAQDYVSIACAFPVAAARAVCARHRADATSEPADSVAAYALLLRLAGPGGHDVGVRHIHRVTTSTPAGYWSRPCPERITFLGMLLAPLQAHVVDGPFGTASIRWPLPSRLPLVSIVVPTRDRLDLLQPCIEGVLEQTRYANFEIIIADNGSVEVETIEFLERITTDPRVRIVSWPHAYNYSAINNFAVQATRGEYVCLLNNDIEILDGEWLGELMRHACRDGAGAVGARLLYPDRSIQHAGVVVGMGNAAGHAHRALPEGEPGYFAHALIARGATAVTAACLVVSRAMFDAVGGLDEQDLRIAYNDVDFCLKLRAAGACNLYVPGAVLIHHESKSRGQDMAPEHRERYLKELGVLQQRWDTTRFQDPTHHPVLDRSSEIYLTVR